MNQHTYKPKKIPMEFRKVEIPCQNCGRPVSVLLNENGFSHGCVFCGKCQGGKYWTTGSEDFPYQQEF